MKKWQLTLLLLAIALTGAYFIRVFPDPYHKGDPVNIYEWFYKEIDELLHGEK